VKLSSSLFYFCFGDIYFVLRCIVTRYYYRDSYGCGFNSSSVVSIYNCKSSLFSSFSFTGVSGPKLRRYCVGIIGRYCVGIICRHVLYVVLVPCSACVTVSSFCNTILYNFSLCLIDTRPVQRNLLDISALTQYAARLLVM
jgi:hypothetical protein